LIRAGHFFVIEADDYHSSRALISLIRRDDKRHARTDTDVPKEYEDFLIVDHHDETDARQSPKSLALKIVEDNVAA
jgi:hypothetical protein